MSKTNLSKFLGSALLLIALSLGFYACDQKESISPEPTPTEANLFANFLNDHTQNITAQDQGNGVYEVTGEQGTRIVINDALINANGERVRGAIDIKLIEIYTPSDMILNRKQTLADYDGSIKMLESGGEVFVQIFQNGEEVSADPNGDMRLYLPTENTGGARNDMELYYGEEIGEQVIWKPTGRSVPVVSESGRNTEEYLVRIAGILGWINVDVVFGLPGEPVDCVEVIIECDEPCAANGDNAVVAVYVNSLNSAFELTYDHGSGSFKLCGGVEGPIPMGGITVTFVVAIDCGIGVPNVALVTTVVDPNNPTTVIDCGQLELMEMEQFEQQLVDLAAQ